MTVYNYKNRRFFDIYHHYSYGFVIFNIQSKIEKVDN